MSKRESGHESDDAFDDKELIDAEFQSMVEGLSLDESAPTTYLDELDAIDRSNNHLMSSLTANDLKTKGIAAIEASLAHQPEAIISVRGKDRFVVMELAQYHYLRECELDAALAQSRADLAAGRAVQESAAAHMARLEAALAAEGAAAPGQAA